MQRGGWLAERVVQLLIGAPPPLGSNLVDGKSGFDKRWEISEEQTIVAQKRQRGKSWENKATLEEENIWSFEPRKSKFTLITSFKGILIKS